MSYKDPISELLISNFRSEGLASIKEYYNGDVYTVPREDLPVLYVVKDATRIAPADNRNDETRTAYVIGVIYNYTEDIDTSSELVAGVNSLYEIVEGRDENTLDLKTNSLAYILRKHLTLADDTWVDIGAGAALEIDYGIGIEKRGRGIYSLEAMIRCVVVHHQLRGTA